MSEREGYGFSPQDKQMVHQRAQNACEFPAEECPQPNNKIVHHITGCYEARLSGMPKEAVHDPTMNAVMLCDDHALQHDEQEMVQVGSLLVERWGNNGRTLYESKPKHRRTKSHGRRRGRR
jgi:hypothetical protein